MKNQTELREKILKLVEEYAISYSAAKPFAPGDKISYSGRVFDKEEMKNLVDSALEFWLTSGRYTDQFETGLADYLGVKYCSFINSGSSANLLAFMTLTSPTLKERAIKPGDEVITVAAGFPTTVSPIIQYGAVPVFVDITIPQYNIDVSKLENAVSSKTKAVMLAHTLGNPFNISEVKAFCKKHNLWLIEDNCDALGSLYTLGGVTQKTGTFGDIGTSSFYPPHHMTTGEGGAIYTSDAKLAKIMRSMRDWGRDCICPSGQDNICGHRFDGQFGTLPRGYDHKYVYSHFGYNLKATDLQAAIGVAQLNKLDLFTKKRRHNFDRLTESLASLEDKLILPQPCDMSEPSWFGFLMTCRDGIDRDELVRKLEGRGIQTRMLFAGNLIRQPCFDSIRNTDKYRVVGELINTDIVMRSTFWIGLYPGMSDEAIDYMADSIRQILLK